MTKEAGSAALKLLAWHESRRQVESQAESKAAIEDDCVSDVGRYIYTYR